MVTAGVEGDEGELWLALVLVLVVEGGGMVHAVCQSVPSRSSFCA